MGKETFFVNISGKYTKNTFYRQKKHKYFTLKHKLFNFAVD